MNYDTTVLENLIDKYYSFKVNEWQKKSAITLNLHQNDVIITLEHSYKPIKPEVSIK